MFEYFTTKPKRCILEKSTNAINAGILYKDENDIYHYFFKNVKTENDKYIVVTKCRIQEDSNNTVGDHLKVEPKYPKIVNKINWPGLYFTKTYKVPTHITTMFMVQTKYVLQYLNKDVEEKEIILAIQDDKVIICDKNKRYVDEPIPISSIWKDVKAIDCAIMYTVKNVTKMYLFYQETYIKVNKPFFGSSTNKKYKPISVGKEISLLNSVVWNYEFGSKCKSIDTIVPMYNINSNIRIKYYIFQNNSYLRYNIVESKVDIILSDVTLSSYYLLYSQLVNDLKNTSEQLSDDEIINNVALIDKNIYNIEYIIRDLCIKKIKLYKKTKDAKHLVLVLNKTLGLKEQLIFQYSNVLESYNKLDVVQNSNKKCDIKYKKNCINFYNCHEDKCKNINVESTFNYKDSNNIRLDISNDFKIERILYIETYPQIVDSNFKLLWRGLGGDNENISMVLENLGNISSNMGIDAVTTSNNNLVLYKNFYNKDSDVSIKYVKGKYNDKFIKDGSFKKLNKITLLMKNELPVEENNFGDLYELDSICKISSDIYYIFGKIVNSDISRVILYNMKTNKIVSDYAEDVSVKFKEIGKFNDIITVFNLDPQNKLNNSVPSLCFVLNTEKTFAKVISNNMFLNKCRSNRTKECILSETNPSNQRDKNIFNVLNLYLNFTHIPKLKNITAVTYDGTKLYVFKKSLLNIYEKLEDEILIEIGDVPNIDIKDIVRTNFDTKDSMSCKTDIIIKPDVNIYVPKINLKLPKTVKKTKLKNKTTISNFMYLIIMGLFLVVIYTVVVSKKIISQSIKS